MSEEREPKDEERGSRDEKPDSRDEERGSTDEEDSKDEERGSTDEERGSTDEEDSKDEGREPRELGEEVAPKEARLALAAGDAIGVDIREDEQFAELHVAGVRPMDEDRLSEELEGEERQVIVICQAGEQSAEVAKRLRDEDVQASHMRGGMDAWISDQLPTQPSTDPDPPTGEDEPDAAEGMEGAPS